MIGAVAGVWELYMSSVDVGNMTSEQYHKHDQRLALSYEVCKWATIPVILGFAWLLSLF